MKKELSFLERFEKFGNRYLFLTNLYEKYFGKNSDSDPNKHPFKQGYYIHFPRFAERRIGKYKFNDYQEAYQKNIDIFINPGKNKKEFIEGKENLAKEYKIHLMPQVEYMDKIIEELFRAVTNDPELKNVISRFKIVIDEEGAKKEYPKIIPKIVIYCQLGKGNAQRALDKIYQYLGKYGHLGEDKIPRYNRKINNLIHYAQGAGDFKDTYIKRMEELGKNPANGIFDLGFIHFKGGYELDNPAQTYDNRFEHAVYINPADDTKEAKQLGEFRAKFRHKT